MQRRLLLYFTDLSSNIQVLQHVEAAHPFFPSQYEEIRINFLQAIDKIPEKKSYS